MTRHADIDNNIQSGILKVQKQEVTFIDNMKARGYELQFVGNVIARKGDYTLRWVALANYDANRDGSDPRGRDGRRNTQGNRRADCLTIQP